MILQKDFLAKLKDFGLNSYEARLWTALLSRGVSTAGELSDIANVPRSRTYDVLESLEKKGFIVMKLGKPIKYLAVNPAEVVKRIKKQVMEDADMEIKILSELDDSSVLEELELLHKQGVEMVTPSDLSGSFKSRSSMYNQLEAMIRGAEESITIVSTSQGILRKLDAFKRALTKAAKRGVKIRVAAPLGEEVHKVAKEFKDILEVRNLEGLNARFVIVDGAELAFMLLNDDDVHPNFDVGIWVNTPFFTSAIESLFELAWKSMKEIKV
jgi:HTH-type transcriptional regulator, sugar sensing transcriptional regulator